MIREFFKKGVVFGIIILCIGVCITSCTSSGSNRLMAASNMYPETRGRVPPTEEWNKTFGAPYLDDAAYEVQQTNDGGFIIGGYARSFGIAFINPWLIKIDSEGNMEWNKTFDYYSLPSISGRIWSVQQTTDDGYILGCTFFNMIMSISEEDQPVLGTNHDLLSSMVLIKTDSQGNEEWNKTYTGLNYSWCFSVRQTLDGGYVATGGGNVSTDGSPDLFLLKTHSDGGQLIRISHL